MRESKGKGIHYLFLTAGQNLALAHILMLPPTLFALRPHSVAFSNLFCLYSTRHSVSPTHFNLHPPHPLAFAFNMIGSTGHLLLSSHGCLSTPALIGCDKNTTPRWTHTVSPCQVQFCYVVQDAGLLILLHLSTSTA